ncbi:hypothetical protein JCM21142_41715 [Saccharicrinis fermentans DSM 9555 = JCM 21142]|uniref:Uncharacterized protein n=1 Tax=Saccharicrinis fermentans DSM 9555 = JCM 21142 TaxID=869213 RepID=W7YL52_9BACT|nr:hypothetical protein JCM21142_41715 [Saccharicrinis fermentans DSM 9555 = JCM 21142]
MEGLASAYNIDEIISYLEKAIQLNWRANQLRKPDFIVNYMKDLKRELEYLDKIKYSIFLYVFVNDKNKSPNLNGIRLLCLLKDNKYILLLFQKKRSWMFF